MQYGQASIPDVCEVTGKVECNADLVAVPDVTLTLTNAGLVEDLFAHHCAQVPVC